MYLNIKSVYNFVVDWGVPLYLLSPFIYMIALQFGLLT